MLCQPVFEGTGINLELAMFERVEKGLWVNELLLLFLIGRYIQMWKNKESWSQKFDVWVILSIGIWQTASVVVGTCKRGKDMTWWDKSGLPDEINWRDYIFFKLVVIRAYTCIIWIRLWLCSYSFNFQRAWGKDKIYMGFEEISWCRA